MRPNNWLVSLAAAAVVALLGTSVDEAHAQKPEREAPKIVNPFKDETRSGIKISEAGVLYHDGSGSVDQSKVDGFSLKLNPSGNGKVVIADMDGTPVLSTSPSGTLYADLPPGEYQISGDGDSCQQIKIAAGASQKNLSLGSGANCEGGAVSTTAAVGGVEKVDQDGEAATDAGDEIEEEPEDIEEEIEEEPVRSASASSSSSAANKPAATKPKAQPKSKPRVIKFIDRDKANPPGVDIQTQTSDAGIKYVTGGIGRRETAFMQSEFGNYSFMLTNTSTSDGRKAHVADVHVVVTDSQDKEVLHAKTQGPWLLAQLKPGRYKMLAHFEGNSKEQSFVVGRSQRKIDIHWPSADLGLDKSGEKEAKVKAKGETTVN